MQNFPGVVGVSSNYIKINASDTEWEFRRLKKAWHAQQLPLRQRKLVDSQLTAYRKGTQIAVFDVLTNALRNLPVDISGMSLLEVGCSSGYYSEVFEIAGLNLKYYGCDYSEPFIRMAFEKYPTLNFCVDDATSLHYSDNSFDIVVSGCCLLHIPEYPKALKETVRVCKSYVVFHRTPVVWGQSEQWYRKFAYGVETVEIHFNEKEFLALIHKNELELLATYTLDEKSHSDDNSSGMASRTYVCKKVK